MKERTAIAHAQTLPAVNVLPIGTMLRAIVVLLKLRIGFAIMLAALGGAVLAASSWPPVTDTLVLAISVLIAAGGAGAFNHWYDRDIDALMSRTSNRPFVNGTLTAHLGWPLICAGLIVAGSGLAAWYFNALAGAFVATGALTYALIYTVWLKRRTHWNIVIGGAAGSWAVLAGAAAAGNVLNWPVALLAIVLFLWTPSHFWSLATGLADDYRRASVPMLPATHGRQQAVSWNLANTLLLVVSTICLAVLVNAPILWITVLAGSGWLAWTTCRMVRDHSRPVAMTAFKASLIQLGLLLIGLFASYAVP